MNPTERLAKLLKYPRNPTGQNILDRAVPQDTLFLEFAAVRNFLAFPRDAYKPVFAEFPSQFPVECLNLSRRSSHIDHDSGLISDFHCLARTQHYPDYHYKNYPS